MVKYFDDEKDNVAFERCIDVMTNMLMKYGPQVLQNRRDAMVKAVEYDIFYKWSGVNVKRYMELFCKIRVSENNKVA